MKSCVLQDIIDKAIDRSPGFAHDLNQNSFTLHEDGTSSVVFANEQILNHEQTLSFVLLIIAEWFVEE